MLDRLRLIPGAELDFPAYSADFDREYDTLTGVIWKLERHQAFSEPGDPSWDALVAGDWGRALRLNDAEWPAVRDQVAAERDRGVETRRLRIVQTPVSPYVQWEMHYLRLLAEAGERHRVLDASRVRDLEAGGVELPEILVFGDRLIYELRYDPSGTPSGARRITDRDVVVAAANEVGELFASAEPLLDYFHREITPLPAPTVHGSSVD